MSHLAGVGREGKVLAVTKTNKYSINILKTTELYISNKCLMLCKLYLIKLLKIKVYVCIEVIYIYT